MRNKSWLWLSALVLGAILVGLFLGGRLGAPSSTRSREARGWFAMRHYLEARGAQITLRDRSLAELASDEILVLAFPFQKSFLDGELTAVGDLLRAGGTVLFAYDDVGNPIEQRLLTTLGLDTVTLRASAPLAPWRWWSYQSEEWTLTGAAHFAGAGELRMAAPVDVPAAPDGARVFFRADLPDGEPTALVFDYRLHHGRVVALPAELLANGRLGEAANADLLETFLAWLGPQWTFDEYHHGLIATELAGESRSAWDLFMLHLILLYLLAALALSRRFGPVWRDAVPAAGSTAAFLRSLGVLHHRLGHHEEASQLLVERARRLDPGLPLEAAASAVPAADGKALVALAKEVAQAQQRRKRA